LSHVPSFLFVYLLIHLFIYFAVLGLELRATPWASPPALFCDGFFWDSVARKGRPGKKQTACVLRDPGKGWQSRGIKLKELKREGHIALGRWKSQWSHMQPHVGWALLSASVTCLQVYLRWDSFVLRVQPLDTSPLSLCRHSGRSFTNLPQRLLCQLNFPPTIVSPTICPGWLQTTILLISTSCTVVIIGVSYRCPATEVLLFFFWWY
jgi:hypothetical protein